MRKILRRFYYDQRAVTPVLSNLLLTVIAVAAMSLATTATYVITANLQRTMSERIVIEDLWFEPSGAYICVYIRNIGRTSIHVSAVYVNHTAQNPTPPFSLEIGEHGWLNLSHTWSPGNLYHLNIVTSKGMHFGDYYEAPNT